MAWKAISTQLPAPASGSGSESVKPAHVEALQRVTSQRTTHRPVNLKIKEWQRHGGKPSAQAIEDGDKRLHFGDDAGLLPTSLTATSAGE